MLNNPFLFIHIYIYIYLFIYYCVLVSPSVFIVEIVLTKLHSAYSNILLHEGRMYQQALGPDTTVSYRTVAPVIRAVTPS
jgi:hypothetical protein